MPANKILGADTGDIGKIQGADVSNLASVMGVEFEYPSGFEWLAWGYNPYDPLLSEWLETQIMM